MDNGASSYHRFLMGDKNGISQIVYDYYDGLVLYLNTWLNNLYDAEDMAQETLAVLISKKPTFNEKCSFKTWLYAIGRNVTVKFLRKNHRMIVSPPEEVTLLSTQEQDACYGCVLIFEECYGLSILRPCRQTRWQQPWGKRLPVSTI